mmetsp:Transcript_64524/g.120063  ORF Transcript_64524/g.120063 Transcript_64524/m.120063 type:complete len:375 (+) Transcript_64524:48-1172(+)
MTDWSVLVFGDSWAKYSHATWPEALARKLRARCFNYALPGDVSLGLANQARMAMIDPQVPKAPGGLLRRETLVVVHTGGNDFIQKIMQVGMAVFGGQQGTAEILQPNPGRREAELIQQFMETMHRAGARHFLISGVPAFIHMPIFTMMPIWGIVQGLVNDRRLEGLGISPGDPAQLVVEVQAASINERWSEMVGGFAKSHTEARCLFFNEVEALERIRLRLGERACDTQCWDPSMFHPSIFGHDQLADEAKVILDDVRWLAPRDAAPAAAQQATSSTAVPPAPPAKVERPEVPITVQVKNVKGTASFKLKCNANGTVSQLKEAILAEAPPEAKGPPGAPCVLVFKGQMLKDAEGILADSGITDDALVVFVVKGT